MKHRWRECARFECRKIFDQKNDNEHCSLSCARFAMWDKRDPERFSSQFSQFLKQPEVNDPEGVERAFWRVFAKWG